jgi:hypothetical protein
MCQQMCAGVRVSEYRHVCVTVVFVLLGYDRASLVPDISKCVGLIFKRQHVQEHSSSLTVRVVLLVISWD